MRIHLTRGCRVPPRTSGGAGGCGVVGERPDTMHVIHRYIGLLAGDSPVKVLRDSVQRSRTRPSGDCARGGGAAAAADP